MRRRSRYKVNKKVFIAVIAVVLILALALGILWWQRPDLVREGAAWLSALFKKDTDNGDYPLLRGEGELRVHFIDVGQGDCIFIEFPDGKTMLIDAGNANNSSEYKNAMLAYLDARLDSELTYVMLTHGDSDHCYFLDDVILEYDVSQIFMPNILSTKADAAIDAEKLAFFTDPHTIDTNVYADFFNAALLEEGAQITLNIGVITIETEYYRLKFYCPTQQYWDDNNLASAEAKNAVSPIGILEYNGYKTVLTGDSNEINEPLFMDNFSSPIDCDVLKVGHHGSESSSTPAFLDYITCEYAVISANSAGNSYGHPREDLLNRLTERNMTIYRTDLNGNIMLTITQTDIFFYTSA
jgi:competence protein ComEC